MKSINRTCTAHGTPEVGRELRAVIPTNWWFALKQFHSQGLVIMVVICAPPGNTRRCTCT